VYLFSREFGGKQGICGAGGPVGVIACYWLCGGERAVVHSRRRYYLFHLVDENVTIFQITFIPS